MMRSKEQENKRRQRRRKKQLERAIRAQSVSLETLRDLTPRAVVSFDLEMAGAFPDDIIEIGAIRLPLGHNTIEVFRRLIKPRTFINRTVRNMTGLTKEALRDKSTLDVILPEFLDFVDPEDLVVGHAIGDNDLLSINLALMRMNRKKGTNILFCPRYLDTVRLAQTLLPKRKKYNLIDLLASYGWHSRQKHRAFEDALSSYVLLECLLKGRREKPAWLPEILKRKGGEKLVTSYLTYEKPEKPEKIDKPETPDEK